MLRKSPPHIFSAEKLITTRYLTHIQVVKRMNVIGWHRYDVGEAACMSADPECQTTAPGPVNS